MCARFGRRRRCAVSKTYKYSMQRSAVNQKNLQCLGYPVSRSRERIIFCIVAIIKKQNNNEVNISNFVIK